MKESFLIISGFLILESLLTSGCFITNCPPGGKRSGSDTKIRQCESCGPPGLGGLCYGPHICCSSFGCMLGTSETTTCFQENLVHNTPCQNPGESCSGNDEGINGLCAGPGICCSTETCTLDDHCHNLHREKENDPNTGQQPTGGSGSGHITSHPKEHSFGGGGIFQNPIMDRWIPRRFSLGGGGGGRRSASNMDQRRPVRVTPSDIQVLAAETPFLDRLLYSETQTSGRSYNEDY